MDNITHSLVGAAIAQAAIQYRTQQISKSSIDKDEESSKSTASVNTAIAVTPMVVVSMLANNFPDLDLLATLFTDPRLGYLLHHRGHTHTLMFVPVQVILLIGMMWLFSRWKRPKWSRSDWSWMIGLGVLGGVVHLGMDSWNVYGLHPFWPFDNQWFYGDFVFIVEPLIWLSLIPWLSVSTQRRWVRNVLLFLYAFGMTALVLLYFHFWWYPLGVIVISLVFGWLVRSQMRERWRGIASFAAVSFVLFSLLLSCIQARSSIIISIQGADSRESLLDVAMISYPSNPFCYEFVTMGYRVHDRKYVLRKGVFSLIPKMIKCPAFSKSRNAPMKPTRIRLHPPIGGFIGKVLVFEKPFSELRELAKTHCQVRAVLKFARVPFWQKNKKGVLFGDMRFDRTKGFDLAEFQFANKPKTCPAHLPPWMMPLKSRHLLP